MAFGDDVGYGFQGAGQGALGGAALAASVPGLQPFLPLLAGGGALVGGVSSIFQGRRQDRMERKQNAMNEEAHRINMRAGNQNIALNSAQLSELRRVSSKNRKKDRKMDMFGKALDKAMLEKMRGQGASATMGFLNG